MERLFTLFRDPSQQRPRAGWRLLIAAVVYLLAAVGAIIVTEALLVAGGGPSLAAGEISPPILAVMGVTQLVAFGVATVLLGLAVDRRTIPDFGLRLSRRWWVDLGFGLGLGAALQTGVFLVALGAGWIQITAIAVTTDPGASFAAWLVAAAVGYLGVGIYEELFARGYLLTNVAEGLAGVDRRLAVATAVLVSSGLFAVLHGTNPNATVWSTTALIVAGVLLATGLVLTGEIAIPIGIHITWNFFQGVVWGFPVSGVDTGVSIVAIEQTGPTLATGGSFGPEGGLFGIAAALLGIVATAAWVYRREGELQIAPELTRPQLRHREK
jgi:membrane protease YdiL (CAAX protease family)